MIGVDTVDIARMESLLAEIPGMQDRLFTSEELAYCRAKPRPHIRMAGTLAAKEAVIKALGLGTLAGWARRVHIQRDADGAPRATVQGREEGNVSVSISHDGNVAVAIAIAAPAFGSGERPARWDEQSGSFAGSDFP